jgi:hypothetical protein
VWRYVTDRFSRNLTDFDRVLRKVRMINGILDHETGNPLSSASIGSIPRAESTRSNKMAGEPGLEPGASGSGDQRSST